ncbi:MAG: nitrile hydratase accessory protein [Mycobacteriaceae bacterium]
MIRLTDVGGPAAPPRANGELVFSEPWESRAFAMAVSLAEANVFSWGEFQKALIARIARHDTTSTPWRYYRHWLDALEDVLANRGALRQYDVTARASELSQRHAGHDHAPR